MPLALVIKSGQVFGGRSSGLKVRWLKALNIVKNCENRKTWLKSLEHLKTL
jgi:hypothetical protein